MRLSAPQRPTAARAPPGRPIRRRPVLLAFGLLAALAATTARAAPALLLANVYRDGVDLSAYWVSEKYDGVRGYWTGTRLLTRGGEAIAAPAWFTAGWPDAPLDGELWAGRGRFAHAVSTVRRQTPDDDAWREMRFMVFDLPAHGGSFDERLPALQALVAAVGRPWVQPVAQQKVASAAQLQVLLARTTATGGEGLMLHRGASRYVGARSDDLLKLKTHLDADARVLAILPGRGRHAGRMGALLVEAEGDGGAPGPRFKLGTGFSDAERRDPPAVGSWVSYRFRDRNASGIPRFASFLRVRGDR